jgi:PTS system cellobiose-specific IIC component
MIVIILIATLLWTFGMHGTMIAVIAIMPVMMQDIAANAAAVAAGNEPQFYASMLFMTAACAGGTGNTLGLVIHGSRSKSEQIKSISRVSLIPSLFNINEPVIFGMPIMLNPILAIPFMLVPAITAILVWIGYSIGFFVPPHIFMFSVMPIGFMEFFSSLAWQNIFIPVIGLVVGLIVYYPFLKVYEKQLLENEAKANVE